MKTPVLCAVTAALAIGMTSAQAGDASAGETLYAEACAQCHGPKARGMASFPSLAGNDEEFIVSRLEQYRAGEKVGPNSGLMIPNAADLSDADIANLATYISTRFQ
ncbi:MAG: c-type cytochrome [Oleiphilaceae bacterium]|nr:c-type cytochrome [Oleiphilaceae bacterium]